MPGNRVTSVSSYPPDVSLEVASAISRTIFGATKVFPELELATI